MSHLSELGIDRLASGIEPEPAAADHAARCARCRERVEAAVEEAALVRASPRFRQGLARLRAAEAEMPVRSWRLGVLGPVLAAAAACTLVLILSMPAEHTADHVGERAPVAERLKGGGVAVWLMRPGGERPTTDLVAGDVASLYIRSGGHPHALVLAANEDGSVVQLWPVEGDASGALPEPGGGRLDPPLRATAGRTLVLAFLLDAPLPAPQALDALRRAVAACPGRPLSLECVEPEPLPSESGRARLLLQVSSPP